MSIPVFMCSVEGPTSKGSMVPESGELGLELKGSPTYSPMYYHHPVGSPFLGAKYCELN